MDNVETNKEEVMLNEIMKKHLKPFGRKYCEQIGNCQDNPESSSSRHGLFWRTSIYTGE